MNKRFYAYKSPDLIMDVKASSKEFLNATKDVCFCQSGFVVNDTYQEAIVLHKNCNKLLHKLTTIPSNFVCVCVCFQLWNRNP